MRRRLGNHLILLAYRVCPALKTELQRYVEHVGLRCFQAGAEQAEHKAVRRLLEHQKRAAQIASRQ